MDKVVLSVSIMEDGKVVRLSGDKNLLSRLGIEPVKVPADDLAYHYGIKEVK